MRNRFLIWTGALAVACASAQKADAPKPAAAETAKASPGLTQLVVSPKVPRTKDGKPDLQGFWNGATLTPLERPRNNEGKAALTEDEAAQISKADKDFIERRAQPSDGNRTAPPKGGDGSTGPAGNVGGYNTFWIDRGDGVTRVNGELRTSLVVDPPDGRVPPLSPEAQARRAAAFGRGAVRPTSDAPENVRGERPGAYDDVELRPLGERCLVGFGSTSGPPALPVMYNNIKQLVVTPQNVLILNEMVHDARIVRMNQKHLPPTIKKWLGDSIGHWEGDTLVVETTNFTNKTRFRGSGENLKVTERFQRPDENTILYQFTVEDPTTWTKPWSGEYSWARSDEPLYEYACHEANYSLEGILRGARLQEAERKAAAEKADADKAKPAARTGSSRSSRNAGSGASGRTPPVGAASKGDAGAAGSAAPVQEGSR